MLHGQNREGLPKEDRQERVDGAVGMTDSHSLAPGSMGGVGRRRWRFLAVNKMGKGNFSRWPARDRQAEFARENGK